VNSGVRGAWDESPLGVYGSITPSERVEGLEKATGIWCMVAVWSRALRAPRR